MKISATAILTVLTAMSAAAIIPRPNQMKKTGGNLELRSDAVIAYADESDLDTAEMLAACLRPATGFNLPVKSGTSGTIVLQRVSDPNLGEEGYALNATEDSVRIAANTAPGLFYGMQSLRQLLPPEIFGGQPVQKVWTIPYVEIRDRPRFKWRGMHLDVGRHFFATAQIKRYIDLLALHKINTFHWHLSDDQGWRVEIKKYPKLTTIGAYRSSTPPYGNRNGSDGKRYGGFYTQDQVRDIVRYAQERHITIVPEIDMPGHMAAAIAAYPEFGNTDIPGYKPAVQTRWGVFPYILSPTENTFRFVDDILTEICEMFPSEYIHIGGDEAPKVQWKESKTAQDVIKREGLKNEHELQSYFIRRLEKILAEKGRRLLGWDEIREGGLSPNATVMSWRGVQGGIDSAREGHDVVMAPTTFTYLDYYQNQSGKELAKGIEYECIGGYLPIDKVYSFDPVLPGTLNPAEQKHILGVQAQLWTEYMKSWDKVEYMAFPRVAALCEVAWTAPENKDYVDFLQRLVPLRKAYRILGVNAYDGDLPVPPRAKKGSSATSSMAHYDNHQALCAFDGDKSTFFWSNRPPKPGDHLTISFDKPTEALKKISVETGGSGKQINDTMQNGVLETTDDGRRWQKIADFKDGSAAGSAPAGTKEIRLRCTGDQQSWLIVKEIDFD